MTLIKRLSSRGRRASEEEIRSLARQVARWIVAAEQDAEPSIAVLHANYGVGWLDALRELATPEQVQAAVGIPFKELRTAALAAQDRAAAQLAGRCPKAVPQHRLARLAGEA